MPGTNLTKLEAQARSAIISDVRYQVDLTLSAQGDTFPSRTIVDFKASPGASTFIDLIAPEVKEITLNGVALAPEQVYQEGRIELADLAAENHLEVVAECAYMHTGEGLHRFSDPADGLSYVYTQFEVPDARRVYACFEQPDLKASYSFTVTTPNDWVVLSNQVTPAPRPAEDGKHTFEFAPTLKMSTYITAIVAGPYYEVRDTLTSADGREIPLGVYCRQSLREYLDADFVIDQTKKGFKFYEAEFDYPYPFEKYDQIFVPEYNAGAMENAGCVTFRDEYVFRTRPTQAQLEALSDTILHELAHMWFGDLVTMKWWDDLWLNESFAEFMSYLAMAEGTEFSEGWTGFGIRKMWGLSCDQMPTTHPIVAPIRDLADVEVNFDGITYSKGGCVLRQLVSYVGRETFMKALNRYFRTHGYANATLADLLRELEEESGRDLSSWTKVWLLEAGITQLEGDLTLNEDGTVKEYAIKQTLPQAGTSLRPHSLFLGCYDFNAAGQLVQEKLLPVEVSGERTVISELSEGKAYPVFLLNDGDIAYAKIRFDARSAQNIREHIDAFADSMPRMVAMCSAWDSVRDGDLAAQDYISQALQALKIEDNSVVVGGVIRHLSAAAEYYAQDAKAARERVSQGLLDLALTAEAGSDRQKQLSRGFLANLTFTNAQLVEEWYQSGQAIPGLTVDTDLQWDMVQALAGLSQDDSATRELIAAQLDKDNTLTGREMAIEAEAMLPTATNKAAFFERIRSDESLSNAQLSAAISGFNGSLWIDPAAHVDLIGKYFEVVEAVWAERTLHMAETIVSGLYPLALVGKVDTDIVALTENWLAAHQDAPDALRRLILEELDGAKRAVKGQSC